MADDPLDIVFENIDIEVTMDIGVPGNPGPTGPSGPIGPTGPSGDAYTNTTPTTIPVSGIQVGTTFTAETLKEVLDILLYPVEGAVTHDSTYGKGGLRETVTLIDRDAIPVSRRREGMMTYVKDTDKFYYLKGGLLNSNWTEFAGTKELLWDAELNAYLVDNG